MILGALTIAMGLMVGQVEAMREAPIIGVLSQPRGGGVDGGYIAGSYVQWLEMAGSRVIPLLYDSPLSELDLLVQGLDGVLFTGGGAEIVNSTYREAGEAILSSALQHRIPLWGTCLGFELLSVILSQDDGILESVEAHDLYLPLNFTREARSSRLFGRASPDIRQAFAREALTVNEHSFGLSSESIKGNQLLSDQVVVLSTNVDVNGVEFVSSWEMKHHNIYAVQFHPEKNPFNWNVLNAPHSGDAMLISQYLANRFLEDVRARNNSNRGGLDFNSLFIHNHPITFDPKAYFEIQYFFAPQSKVKDTISYLK